MPPSFIQNLLDNWKCHIMEDERLVSKTEGKTIFSRRLEQFDGLTWLTPTPLFLRQIYATAEVHIQTINI